MWATHRKIGGLEKKKKPKFKVGKGKWEIATSSSGKSQMAKPPLKVLSQERKGKEKEVIFGIEED